MNYLKTRIKKLEQKASGNGTSGIREWALLQARYEAKGGIFTDELNLAMHEACVRDGIKSEKPKPNRVWTEEEIMEYARQLSQKFASQEEFNQYENSRINWSPIDDAIADL